MIENDAALHRCVGDFIRRVQELLAVGHTRDFIVQALQGAVEWVSPSGLAARMARETPTFSFPQEPTMFEVSRVDAAVGMSRLLLKLVRRASPGCELTQRVRLAQGRVDGAWPDAQRARLGAPATACGPSIAGSPWSPPASRPRSSAAPSTHRASV
jgi:hypothetical protein